MTRHLQSLIPAVILVLTGSVDALRFNTKNDVCPWPVFDLERLLSCRIQTPDNLTSSDAIKRTGWHGPHDCVDEYCIYSNHDIGDGIVLVTTAENAKLVAGFPPVTDAVPRTPGFEVADVPGKGSGLVAKRKIRKGEHIMISPPAMMVHTDAHKELSAEDRSSLYDLAVDELPDHGRQLFMRQTGNDVADKLDKNGFGMHIGTEEGGGHIGGFPGASRMNHDCRPNIAYRISNITHITTAIRNIAPGEELTISYINAQLPRSERQDRLEQWGFKCKCAHCSMSDADAEASDARIRRIAELETELDNPQSKKVTADTGAELVALYEKERLDIYLAPAYTRAALNYGLFADEVKARQYAYQAIAALTRQSGPKAGDLPSMKMLAQDPRSHWTWGKRQIVQVPVEDIKFE